MMMHSTIREVPEVDIQVEDENEEDDNEDEYDDDVFKDNSQENIKQKEDMKSETETVKKQETINEKYDVKPEVLILPPIIQESDEDRLTDHDEEVSTTSERAVSTPELTKEQIREIKEAFNVFDSNGDGCISATEIKKLVTSLGYTLTEAELMDMMNMMDADGNGAIDFPEFLEITSRNLHNTDQEDSLVEAFHVFDRDNSGSIGRTELEKIMRILGQEFKDYELDAMIKAADADGDGTINLEDFMKLMAIDPERQ